MPAIIQQEPRSVLAKSRVLYIGTAVPLETKTGLEALQQPLRERYNVDHEADMEGVDTLLTVTNTDIQMQFLSDPNQIVQFPIPSLTICAAVRCVVTVNSTTGENNIQFCSLNSPQASSPANVRRPAIFSAICRRSQGRKVLECHSFICASARDALNLVRMASFAGEKLKGRSTMPISSQVQRPVIATAGTMQNRSSNFNRTSAVRTSVISNGGVTAHVESNMHLKDAEPIVQNIKPGREFYEPVNPHGYFYTSDKTEVKKYNIEKIDDPNNNVANTSFIDKPAENGSEINGQAKAPSVVATMTPRPVEPQLVPVQVINGGPPPQPRQPVLISARPPPQHPMVTRVPVRVVRPPPPPMMYGPPPPPMIIRPRFFSPPPPRMRPLPYMYPSQPAPITGPIMAPPIFMRRPPRPRSRHSSGSRSPSKSRSRSGSPRSKSGSRSRSRSKSPVDENTRPKIPNGDVNTSSEEEFERPNTPPKDYDKRGNRMSRREEFEVRERYRRHDRPNAGPYGPPPALMPPNMYDYYVYPPRHGGYEPFMMYNPHIRSRSVPPANRYRSKSPKKKSKKHKKNRKDKRKQPKPRGLPRRDDLSTDSYAGYNSELPSRPRLLDETQYSMYPPRDFRRSERQFMNERNFAKSITAESRRSVEPKQRPPTAYELNESITKAEATNGDADFTMY